MKISFITTVLNEEKTIDKLLYSLNSQIVNPDEVIIVDGGSSDGTVKKINKFIKSKENQLKIKLIKKKGNRSIGRNKAISKASGDIILSSDAGCRLDKNWIKYITEPFNDKDIDVVAGYYKSDVTNIFEKSLTPYVLVMEDRVNPKDFLPATRSMAFRKDIWEKSGKFDEKLSHNEDFAFANKFKENSALIFFEKKAIAYWIPKRNLKEAFIMFYRFALGDVEAGIFRKKVLLVFVRYFGGIILVVLYLITNWIFLLMLIGTLFANYILWAILKNYKYVGSKKAIIYLPILQLSADFAVLSGTAIGFIRGFSIKK